MTETILWKCEVCGYVHAGPEPPAVCPVCGVGAEQFSRMAVQPTAARATPAAERWRCTICDHVHEGADPPERCPVCSAPRALFKPVSPAPRARGAVTGHILIVGTGVAGVTAAEHARATAPQAEITLLGKESAAPYLRLNLTRYLAGEVSEPTLALHPPAWYAEQRIAVRQGEVVSLEPEARAVRLRTGERVPYDALVLACGAHAFVPPIPGVAREGVFVFRTLADAQQILARATAGARCVCIGGGLLGLETAGALGRLGVQVTVVEGFGWLLPRQLPEAAGRRLEAHLASLGIAVRCGAGVKALRGDEAVASVLLGDDSEIAVDFVVLSAGVRANSHLARAAGLKVDRAVVVDDRMQTSAPGVFAAGDVAEHRGQYYGIWPTAYAQGMVAGINAAGGEADFTGMPRSNRLKVLDVDLFSIGRVAPEDASDLVYERETEGAFARIVVRDGLVVGAALYGETALAPAITEAMERGLRIPETTLAAELETFTRR